MSNARQFRFFPQRNGSPSLARVYPSSPSLTRGKHSAWRVSPFKISARLLKAALFFDAVPFHRRSRPPNWLRNAAKEMAKATERD